MTSVSSTTEVSNHYYVATPIRWGYRLCTNLTGKLSTPSSRLFKFLGIATVISLVYAYTIYRPRKPPKKDAYEKAKDIPPEKAPPKPVSQKAQLKNDKNETLTKKEEAIINFFKEEFKREKENVIRFVFTQIKSNTKWSNYYTELQGFLEDLKRKNYISKWEKLRCHNFEVTLHENFIKEIQNSLT